MPIVHPDDRLSRLANAIQDLVVFDLQLGVALCLLPDLLAERVVLAGIWSHIGQNGQLVNVGIVLWIDILQLCMDGFIAGTGQTSESLIDLDVGIAHSEVGVVIVARHPRGHGVGNLIRLWLESFTLNETTDGLDVVLVRLPVRYILIMKFKSRRP